MTTIRNIALAPVGPESEIRLRTLRRSRSAVTPCGFSACARLRLHQVWCDCGGEAREDADCPDRQTGLDIGLYRRDV
jgi:hypothetical protein